MGYNLRGAFSAESLRLVPAAARTTPVEIVRSLRRAIAASHLTLGNNVKRSKEWLLSANDRPIRIGSVHVRSPSIQRHRITAATEFRRVAIGRRHSTTLLKRLFTGYRVLLYLGSEQEDKVLLWTLSVDSRF